MLKKNNQSDVLPFLSLQFFQFYKESVSLRITIYMNDIPQGASQKRTRVSQEDTAATPTPYADLETALSSHANAPRVLMGTAERVTVGTMYFS